MSTSNLLWFAAAVGVALLLLLWRLIRAEDGYGFLPISEEWTYILLSAFFGALSIGCFVFAFVILMSI